MIRQSANNPFPSLKNAGFIMPRGVNMESSTYEGARTGRRLGTWGLSQAGPNISVVGSVTALRGRSHEVIRNNPHARSAIEHYVSNMIGSGIRPRWNIDDKSLKEELQILWNDWVDEADAYERTNLYGIEELVARTEFESGEALVRFRTRRIEDGLAVPMQLQVLEPDHLDYSLTQMLPNGRSVHFGIELDAIGRRSHYHLWRMHPGDGTMMSNMSDSLRIRVPAEEILHIYRMLRPGQMRGVIGLSAVLVHLKEIDETKDAEIVRRKTATLLAGFIRRKTEDGLSDPTLGTDENSDENNQPIRGLEPGTMQYLDDNEDITWSDPPDVGQAVQGLLDNFSHAVAAGAGVTFEQLTGDLSKVNFSSIRAGLIEFRRKITMLQKNMVIFQFCRPVANRFAETAIASGAINIKDFMTNRRAYKRISWRPDAFEYVKPLEDVMTDVMEVRAGFSPREDKCSERGNDIEEVDKKTKAANDRTDMDGIIYDSDPRHTNKSGTAQSAEEATAINSVSGADEPIQRSA